MYHFQCAVLELGEVKLLGSRGYGRGPCDRPVLPSVMYHLLVQSLPARQIAHEQHLKAIGLPRPLFLHDMMGLNDFPDNRVCFVLVSYKKDVLRKGEPNPMSNLSPFRGISRELW